MNGLTIISIGRITAGDVDVKEFVSLLVSDCFPRGLCAFSSDRRANQLEPIPLPFYRLCF